MDDCIFCKIVKGDIPANKVWENNDLLCFLDIDPISKGHCLILPKEHFEKLQDTPDSISSWILPKIKETMTLLKEKLGADSFNIVQNNGKLAGQEVPHLHFHLIPIYKEDDAHVVCGKSTNPDAKNFEEILDKLK